MKKQIVTTAILVGCLIAVGVSSAQAQIISPVRANIPFSFFVGEKLLPAGEYTIREQVPGMMKIQRDDGKDAAFFITVGHQKSSSPKTSDLVFNRYGNKTFLTRVEVEGNRDDAELVKSKLEKRAERKGSNEDTLSVLLRY